MWFSPFLDWWLEWPNPLARDRLSRNPADIDQRGSAAELLVDQGLWVKGFVGKTLWRHLDTQWHQEMPVAEGVEERNLADRFREQLHRDGIGFEALHILGQVVKIEPMSRAFPETRVCSRATLFAVPSFSVLIETGECESSSFTAGTSALRAVGESFARPSSSSSRWKTTLASSGALGMTFS